jgi:Tfp pilus assembly protein PilO
MNRALLPILLIIIALITFFWWTNPHYENVKLLQTQLGESNAALARAQELEDVRKKLVDKENTFSQSDLAKLQKFLPDNIDNIRLFLDVQGVASRYGTSIQDISVADQGSKIASTQAIGPSDKQYGQMALGFSINISYENLSLFLKDLEKGLRIVEIKSLSFATDDKNPNLYKVSVNVNAFWLNAKTKTTITSSQ